MGTQPNWPKRTYWRREEKSGLRQKANRKVVENLFGYLREKLFLHFENRRGEKVTATFDPR